MAQTLLHNLIAYALYLDVHLERCYPVSRSCHLEVHIAKGILQPLDVGKHGKFAILSRYQAHGYAGYWRLDGHTGVHEG